MRLKSLYLSNFRNYEEVTFHFSPGVNAIVGPNALGKTNLLEALHFLVTGRSFRTPHLSDLVRFGTAGFYLEVLFIKDEVEQTLKIECDGKGRRITYNKSPIASLSALLGILVGTLLSPEDQALVKGHPHMRRHYLDLQIAQANPLYLHHLSRYHRAMKHRNALLRLGKCDTIDVWEEEMASSADYITWQRDKTAAALGELSSPLQELLSQKRDALSIRYKSAAIASGEPAKQFYLSQYQKHRKRELEQRTTLFGPHRDDLLLQIGGREARYFASEGQMRSCAAALRFAQWGQLAAWMPEKPIMSIDDVGISLDAEREGQLYSHLDELGQVFLTAPKESPSLPTGAEIIFLRPS